MVSSLIWRLLGNAMGSPWRRLIVGVGNLEIQDLGIKQYYSLG